MSPATGVEVLVSLGAFRGVTVALLERAVRAVLEDADVARAEISLTLLGDDAIRELNRRYLGKDRPTDVLAFSLGTGVHPIGDVYVGVEQARRQARELDVPAKEEIVRLAIHGTLHVLGHDHPEGARAPGQPHVHAPGGARRARAGPLTGAGVPAAGWWHRLPCHPVTAGGSSGVASRRPTRARRSLDTDGVPSTR